jgi:hypothetical protein
MNQPPLRSMTPSIVMFSVMISFLIPGWTAASG